MKKNDPMEDCIFCRIVNGEIKSEIVMTSNNFIAIKDIKPVSEGHILIISKKHYVTLLDLPDNLGDELLKFTKSIASILLESKMGDGFNIIMNNLEPAGQIVKHAHLHIIPRKENDGLKSLV